MPRRLVAREHVPGPPTQGGQVLGGLTRSGTALVGAQLPIQPPPCSGCGDHLGFENWPKDVLHHTATA